MRKCLLLLLLSLPSWGMGKPTDSLPAQPFVVPSCALRVAHVNLFRPFAMARAWRERRAVQQILQSTTLDELSFAVSLSVEDVPVTLTVANQWLLHLREDTFEAPEIAYGASSNIPVRKGFNDFNPLDNEGVVAVLGGMVLRGIKSFSRRVYRSKESILHYRNAGYDALVYSVEHFDGTSSHLLAYMIAEKPWFAPYGFLRERPRTTLQYLITSNGLDIPPTYDQFSNGSTVGGGSAENPEIRSAVDEVLQFESAYSAAGFIFPVTPADLDEPIELPEDLPGEQLN